MILKRVITSASYIRKSTISQCFLSSKVKFSQACHKILGIETSCDDTGAAVVDEFGNILGEKKVSQIQIHIRNGGIIPPIARNLHQQCIEEVVNSALEQSGYDLKDLSAIATTVKPGMPLSLLVGLNHARALVAKSGLPFLPIHHMEAHALTIRMIHKVEFPFVVLLASGGHCQLALVRGVDDFLLLGSCLDNAPGEAFDKFARRLKLKNIPELSGMCGGQAVEILAAQGGNQHAYEYTEPLLQRLSSNFSFSGILFLGLKHIQTGERNLGIMGDELLPDLPDMCASFQMAITRHLIKRVHRGLEFLRLKELIPSEPDRRTLVLSGGVASSQYLRAAFSEFAEKMDYKLLVPPKHLCTDNGIMVAWNGMERFKAGIGIDDPTKVDIDADCPLGKDLTKNIEGMCIQSRELRWLKISLFQHKTVPEECRPKDVEIPLEYIQNKL